MYIIQSKTEKKIVLLLTEEDGFTVLNLYFLVDLLDRGGTEDSSSVDNF